MIWWNVALGCMDLFSATMTMSDFCGMSCEGQCVLLKHVYNYIWNFMATSIKFMTDVHDYSQFEIEQSDWGYVYHTSVEEEPTVMFTIMDRAQTCNNHNSISRTRMIKSRLSITRRIMFWM
jgi:hypothetical protein